MSPRIETAKARSDDGSVASLSSVVLSAASASSHSSVQLAPPSGRLPLPAQIPSHRWTKSGLSSSHSFKTSISACMLNMPMSAHITSTSQSVHLPKKASQ